MFQPYGISFLSIKKAILIIANHMPEIVLDKYWITYSAAFFLISF
jgi:hypothetical protein